MITIILTIFLLGALVPFAIGMLTIYHWFRPQRPPADTSNRINAIRLWWFALTRQEMFVPLFPWLARDEKDNVNGEPK